MSTGQRHNLPTILVVDDSSHDYETYVRYLNKARPNKYRTKFLSVGRHVLSALEDRPHCLILDLSLPDMSGLDIIEQLKAQNGGSLPFPVVMVTGSGDEGTGQKAVQLGAQDYLIKEEVNQTSLLRSIEFAATRFRLEQQLRENEERFRLAAAAAHAMVYDLDVRTMRVNAMKGLFELLGYHLSETEMPLQWWDQRIHSDDLAECHAAFERMRAGGQSHAIQYRVYHKDGRVVWVEDNAMGVRDGDGKLVRIVGTVVDISARKEVEAELRKSQAQLEVRVAERTQELAYSLEKLKSEIAVRKKTEEDLQELSARLLRLQDEEHRRIARELHDSTGQTLAALKLTISTFGSMVSANPGAARLIEDLNALTDEAIRDIRSTAHLLHPPLLDEIGFTSAARWYVEELAKRSGIKVNLEISATPILTKGSELALFRVLQESLTNVLRHSGSPAVDVHLQLDGENALLTIRDYGKGIPSQKLKGFRETGTGVGIGLGGMKQRLRELRGHLTVNSDHTGTSITASLPVSETRKDSHQDDQTEQGERAT